MKAHAYVAVIKGDAFTLGIATRNAPGYHLTDYPTVPTYRDAADWAHEANARLGLTDADAVEIVASSMHAGTVAP